MLSDLEFKIHHKFKLITHASNSIFHQCAVQKNRCLFRNSGCNFMNTLLRLIPEAVSVFCDEFVGDSATDLSSVDEFSLSETLQAHSHHAQLIALCETSEC